MKKAIAIAAVGVLVLGIVSISTFSDQFVDAGSRKKIHFTQTIQSSQDPGQGNENHQLALVLSPNRGTLYDGSITYTSSEPVQLAVLHEISSQEAKGQPVWSVDGKTVYGLSLIDSEKESGSFEFTGAAVGLRSLNSKQFTSTVSVDGWIRGQSTEVIMQKIEFEKEKPSLLLAKANVPVTIPMHKGIFEGSDVLYVITDGSDEEYSDFLTEKQGWKVRTAPPLAEAPQNALQKIYLFKNGVKGEGILGYQHEVFSSTPAQESKYSALGSLVEVTWKPGQKETVFENEEEILEAKESERIQYHETGIVLNTPQIVWPEGQMPVRSNSTISDDMPYGGSQITEIDSEEMTVTFVAHRGWGPDGRTVYCIATDATPSGPAQTMGVVSSPSSANLIASPAAADLFQFRNGIAGTGPLGFQPGIASAGPDDEDYSPMWRIYLVEWNDDDSAKLLETKSDIDSFMDDNLISVSMARPTNSDHVVNCPFVDPFQ